MRHIGTIKKHLIRIEIVLFCVLLFFSVVIILSRSILPKHGIYIYSDIHGTSMEPTMVEGALMVGKQTPYEELQIGDIITFKMRREYRYSTATVSTNWTKGGDEATSESESASEATSESTAEKDAQQPAEYLDESITHRIVGIEDEGYITRGDNNDRDDHFPVTSDAYLAKIVWWNNYLGWPFRIMYEYRGLLWLIGIVVGLGGVTLLLSPSRIQQH